MSLTTCCPIYNAESATLAIESTIALLLIRALFVLQVGSQTHAGLDHLLVKFDAVKYKGN